MAKAVKNILGKGAFKVNGSLWLEKGGDKFFGPGPVELLEFIEETGSINQAARKMQMSYKKAWEIINHLNSTTTRPFVITTTGGEHGGGSSISDEAREMIQYHRLLRERFTRFLEEETNRLKK